MHEPKPATSSFALCVSAMPTFQPSVPMGSSRVESKEGLLLLEDFNCRRRRCFGGGPAASSQKPVPSALMPAVRRCPQPPSTLVIQRGRRGRRTTTPFSHVQGLFMIVSEGGAGLVPMFS